MCSEQERSNNLGIAQAQNQVEDKGLGGRRGPKNMAKRVKPEVVKMTRKH